jgi:DNA mismatch endonuclease (patch repair protein)
MLTFEYLDMDRLSKEKRSWNMSRIRSKNTKPEVFLRSLLYKMGYRFRLNGKVANRVYHKGILPGKPDIVLAKYKAVIFVHGCFWHRHKGCKRATMPKTKTDWWSDKFSKNVARDKKNICELKKLDWHVIVVWECELKELEKLQARLCRELKNQA